METNMRDKGNGHGTLERGGQMTDQSGQGNLGQSQNYSQSSHTQNPSQSYGQGNYGQSQGGYGQGNYGQSQGSYGQGNYGQTQGNYGQGNYGQSQGSYGQTQGNYGQGNYGQTQGGYGQTQGNYGQGHGQVHHRSQGTSEGTSRSSEGRRTRWQREPLTARDIMTSSVKTVTAQSSIKDVAQIMKDENCGIVPVVDESRRLVGVITDRDIVIRGLTGSKGTDIKVQDVMTEDVEAVTPDESILDLIELMGEKQIRRVPVVDRNDQLLGIISIGDLASRADYDEELQDALEKISARRSFWSRLFT